MRSPWFYRTALLATCLAFVVVLLGAYTRLSDAGLGCPDWPGCYGHFDVPKTSAEITKAEQAYPERPVEGHKAWKEMVHRYFAATLGALIIVLAVLAWRRRSKAGQLVGLPLFLVMLVIFQGMLGMWTVTIKLNPTIVMLHLMGGLATISCLFWVVLRTGRHFRVDDFSQSKLKDLHGPAIFALVIVVLQIMLGGWTSANYAALHCPDFPTCQGSWIPTLDFKNAFTLWHGTERNFEFGILENNARATIHFVHRVGALVTFLFVGWLALKLWLGTNVVVLRKLGVVLLLVLCLQVSLGIANVLLSLPLPIAVAHNGVAALLLLLIVALNHAIRPVSVFTQR